MNELAENLTIGKLGKAHYRFNINGTNFVFAYIRKNACSAFKKLVINESENKEFLNSNVSALKFMNEYHFVPFKEKLKNDDITLFVYRDPVDRVISVYKNKFIQQTGNKDIFENYNILTGNNPQDATFEKFVNEYCVLCEEEIDPHCWSQELHLFDIEYDYIFAIDNLYSQSCEVFGKNIANKYFLEKVNSTDSITPDNDECLSYIESSRLHAYYKENKILPKRNQLLTDEIVASIREIYKKDMELVKYIT